MIDSKILLASAQTGNADSFGTLYSMYSRELYLYALKLLGNREDAEDAVQQASLEVYTHLKSIRKPESFKAYYFKALANASRSMLSKKKIHIVSDDEIPEVPDGTDVQRQTEESTGIDSALRKLSDDERQIVLLSVIGGFNSAEIAKITDFARGTVRSKLSRALKKMKAELEGD